MRRLIVTVALALAVAGCGDKKHIEFAKPPADRLVCPDEPAIPAAPVTDEANGKYLRELRDAWAGCKGDVDWMRLFFKALGH